MPRNKTSTKAKSVKRRHRRIVRIRSCLGCFAHEEGMMRNADYCRLGYEVHQIPTVAGFYGKGKKLIGCRCAPSEPCPKPRTFPAFYKLWKESDSNNQDGPSIGPATGSQNL